MADSPERSGPSNSKRFKGSFNYKTKYNASWFSQDNFKKYKNVISNSKLGDLYFFCKICSKDVSCGHGGTSDLVRHCNSLTHQKREKERRSQPSINTFGYKKDSATDILTRKAEVKFTGFLAEHNLPIAAANHLSSLIKECFPDSKIAQSYSCAKTKTFCILNGAIYPDLQQELINEMKASVFSLSTDGSNDQNMEKMNPVTVRIYDVNQHKVVTKFLDMCLSKSSTAAAIFSSIDLAMDRYGIPWSNCIAMGVDNTSVNVGKHKSLIVEARKKNENIILMGCPCHIAHNTAGKGTKEFCSHIMEHFDIEELLVDIYFHFDYSSKRKNLLNDFCLFHDQDYCKIIKLHSVRWLGLSTCIERTLKLYPSLKSYFLSQSPEMKDGERKLTRLNRLIKAFSNEMQEIYLIFLHGALQKLINLNLLLQRSDPIIHLLYDALFDTTVVLLSRFMSPQIVTMYKNHELDEEEIRDAIENEDNFLSKEHLFVGFLAKSKVKSLLDNGDISENQYGTFFEACLNFHKTGFLYALKNFPLNNDLFKHARVFNFLNQKCSFESIHFLTEQLKHYVTFTHGEFLQMEEEFILLTSITLNDFEESQLDEATIRTDENGDSKTYRIDILWYYLYMQKITGTSKSKFENLFKLAKVVLSIVHSNAEEESLFSRVRKNLTAQRASLHLDGTLSSIMSFQLNRPHGEPCYKYNPSDNVIKNAKTATWEYNKSHSSSSSK